MKPRAPCSPRALGRLGNVIHETTSCSVAQQDPAVAESQRVGRRSQAGVHANGPRVVDPVKARFHCRRSREFINYRIQ
jgi:hypothetical protein